MLSTACRSVQQRQSAVLQERAAATGCCTAAGAASAVVQYCSRCSICIYSIYEGKEEAYGYRDLRLVIASLTRATRQLTSYAVTRHYCARHVSCS